MELKYNRFLLKIFKLIKKIQKNIFIGIGKPEGLKHNLSGCWSRKIDREHHYAIRL